MKPSATDSQIFGELKTVIQGLGFSITDEGSVDNLSFAGRFSKDFLFSKYDLSLGYEIKTKVIWIVCTICQTVSPEKQGDLSEVINYINHPLLNVRLSVDPATQETIFKGEIPLFGDPVNREHFKTVLAEFLAVMLEYHPMIWDFLHGYIRKEDILNKVDVNIESWQGRVRQFEKKYYHEKIRHLKNTVMNRGSETHVIFGGHLIFDSFPDMEAAQRFASMIRERYGRVTTVHETRKDADDYLSVHHSVFPLGMYPPIVIVERDPQWAEKEEEGERELEIEKLVSEFGGTFAGT